MLEKRSCDAEQVLIHHDFHDDVRAIDLMKRAAEIFRRGGQLADFAKLLSYEREDEIVADAVFLSLPIWLRECFFFSINT